MESTTPMIEFLCLNLKWELVGNEFEWNDDED